MNCTHLAENVTNEQAFALVILKNFFDDLVSIGKARLPITGKNGHIVRQCHPGDRERAKILTVHVGRILGFVCD